MIIGTAYQDTGLSHTHIADKLEVLLICTDPAGNLRELIASLHTFLNSITVFLTVKEKFRSTNPSFRSAQLMKVIINPYDLLSAVWCSGLLAITECRVGDPDVTRLFSIDISSSSLGTLAVHFTHLKRLRQVLLYCKVIILYQSLCILFRTFLQIT